MENGVKVYTGGGQKHHIDTAAPNGYEKTESGVDGVFRAECEKGLYYINNEGYILNPSSVDMALHKKSWNATDRIAKQAEAKGLEAIFSLANTVVSIYDNGKLIAQYYHNTGEWVGEGGKTIAAPEWVN